MATFKCSTINGNKFSITSREHGYDVDFNGKIYKFETIDEFGSLSSEIGNFKDIISAVSFLELENK